MLAALLAALAHAAAAPATADAEPLAAAPPTLELVDSRGVSRSLAETKGDIVVVNFWATWCLPCRREMPLLQRLSEKYADRGVRFIAASTDDDSTRDLVGDAIAEAGVTFDSWLGADTLDMMRFDLGTGLPATAVLDRDGSVAFRLIGLVDEKELRGRLDWLLAGRETPAPAEPADASAVDDCCADGHDHGDDHAGDEHQDEVVADASAHHDHDHDHGDGHDHGRHDDTSVADASLVPS